MFKIRFLALQLLLVTFLAYSNNTAPQYVIVWDVGNVLASIDKKSLVLHDLGIRYMLQTAWTLTTPTKMRAWMYEALHQYAGHQPEATLGRQPVDDETGTILPAFMAQTWLCSHIPNNEILEHVTRAVAQWQPKTPVSALQRSLVHQTLTTALSAKVLGKNTVCIQGALALVKEFAAQGIPQYVLSNFEEEAFNVMLSNPRNQELFSYIPEQNRTVSGICKLAKPHHSIFKHFEQQHNLHSSQIIFIDDQLRNITAARECGWTAIHLPKGDYTHLIRDLNAVIEKIPVRA